MLSATPSTIAIASVTTAKRLHEPRACQRQPSHAWSARRNAWVFASNAAITVSAASSMTEPSGTARCAGPCQRTLREPGRRRRRPERPRRPWCGRLRKAPCDSVGAFGENECFHLGIHPSLTARPLMAAANFDSAVLGGVNDLESCGRPARGPCSQQPSMGCSVRAPSAAETFIGFCLQQECPSCPECGQRDVGKRRK